MKENIRKHLSAGLKKGDNVFIADSACILGDVTLGDSVGVWFNTTIRGDVASISVGDRSNIQDGCVIHTSDGFPVTIGKNVTVGHNVTLHGCTIEDNCIIGMGSTILDGAVIESGSIVAAGSIVTGGKRVTGKTLFKGTPAKYARDLDEKDIKGIEENAEEYIAFLEVYKEMNIK